VLLFKLPMPSEPVPGGEPAAGGAGALPGGSGRSSRKSADGAKNKQPVTAVEKSRTRS
jgi:hypothetical protein